MIAKLAFIKMLSILVLSVLYNFYMDTFFKILDYLIRLYLGFSIIEEKNVEIEYLLQKSLVH